MKTVLLSSLAFAALAVGGSALAADMPLKAPPPPALFSWTGYYVGLNAGYAWSRASQDPGIVAPNCDMATCPPLLALMSVPQSASSNAFSGGFQAGANYQSGRWVMGLEADIDSLRLRNSFALGPTRPMAGAPITLTASGSVNTDWVMTIRPRVGVAFDSILVYATGGVAFTKQSDMFNDTLITTGGGPFTGTAGLLNVTSSRDIGWVAGGGVEYAIAPQWSLKAEYLHLDFGTVTGSAVATNTPMAFGPSGFTASVLTVSNHLTADIVRAGIDFKLGM